MQYEALNLPVTAEEAATMFTNMGTVANAVITPNDTDDMMRRTLVQHADMTVGLIDPTQSKTPLTKLFGCFANFFRNTDAGSVLRGETMDQAKIARYIYYGVWYATMVLIWVWTDLVNPDYFISHPTLAEIVDHVIVKIVKPMFDTHV